MEKGKGFRVEKDNINKKWIWKNICNAEDE